MEVVHPQRGSSSTWFLVKLEFGNVAFWGDAKTEVTGQKPSSETQGQSVGSRKKAGRKFSSKCRRAPGYRILPNYFQKFKRIPAPDWAQKMLCIIVPNRWTVSPEFFSWVRTRRLSSLAHAPKKCTQSANFQFDMKSPSDFKILSARKLKALFQKYELELTTGIHACTDHVFVNIREFKMPRTNRATVAR